MGYGVGLIIKYTKHMTLKEWNRFNKPVEPDNSFYFINFSTGKKESYDSLTMQEVLLSKYKIILDDYEPKWTRRYHTFTKYVNQKNLDKSITSFNKMVNAFSSGLGDVEKSKSRKKDHDILFGKSKSSTELWGKKKSSTSIWGTKPRTRKKSRTRKDIWNEDKKTSIW